MAGGEPPAGTPVSYSQQYRRCGKAGCLVCGRGGAGHGPYWYAYWREGGRARSRYLGRTAPPGVTDAPGAVAGTADRARVERPLPGAREWVLRVQTLGGFAVWLGDEAIPAAHWRRPMVSALFKALLSAPGHRLARDQVLEALWPEAAPERAAARLRTTVHRLRQLVGAGRLDFRDDQVRLVPGADDSRLDADAFEGAARHALAGRELAACRAALARSGGDYLPEDRYADWAVERREELRRLWLAVLLHAAALCEEAGEIEEAERCLRAALAADRCHEGAARALMRLHARSGRPAQALRVYRRLADALRDELDLAPEPRTRALQRALAEQRRPLPPATPEPARRTNLPVPTTSFIGRRRELAAICGLLTGPAGAAPARETGDREPPCRLVTLVGPGGVGKTRLALAAADEMLDDFPHGVWLADLAPLAGAALGGGALVAGTAVRALGLAEEPGRPPLETLTAAVRDKRLLLVLDNCEHLVAACAVLVTALLQGCPQVRILATSRERLEVAGEHAWPVPPLSLPDEREASAARLPQSEAARLFLDRARAQRPDLALTDENAATIARISSRLAGIPLAIELAAARVGILGLDAIAARLGESLRLLAGGPRSAPSRQRTLRATLDWSWELLEDEERALLRRLAVFAGGWTLDEAEAVCTDEPIGTEAVLDLLAGLARKSLLLIEDQAGEVRYGLLEMVRQYGLERLADAGETESLRGRHLAHYLALAERADTALRGPDQAAWLARLETEHNNLRSALSWASEWGDIKQGLRLVGTLARFWQMRGHQAEGLRWAQAFLGWLQGAPDAARAPEDMAVRARALRGAGILTADQGDYAGAMALYEESRALFAALGDRRGVTLVLNNQGNVLRRQGDFRRAQALFAECLALFRALGERSLVPQAINNLAATVREQGEHDRASTLQEEALGLQRELGDAGGMADSLHNLASTAFERGDYRRARELLEESLALQQSLGNRPRIALETHALALVCFRRGEYAQAQQYFEAALALRRELGDRAGLAHTLNDLGIIAFQQGDDARAARFCQEACAIRREIGERPGLVLTLTVLAQVAAREGDYPRADALFDEAIAHAREIGYRAGLAWTLHDRGCAALWRDDVRAGTLLGESVALMAGLGDRFGIASCLAGLAAVARLSGQLERAVHIVSAAAALRETLEAPPLPMVCAIINRTLAETHAALGEAAFAAAWARGETLSPAQAMELALSGATIGAPQLSDDLPGAC